MGQEEIIECVNCSKQMHRTLVLTSEQHSGFLSSCVWSTPSSSFSSSLKVTEQVLPDDVSALAACMLVRHHLDPEGILTLSRLSVCYGPHFNTKVSQIPISVPSQTSVYNHFTMSIPGVRAMAHDPNIAFLMFSSK